MEQQAEILSVESKPDYGLDSPRVLKGVAVGGAVAMALGTLIRPGEELNLILAGPLMSLKLMGAAMLTRAALMARHSFSGKFVERDRLIASITWRGHERVLDIGCGRGLLMIAAAHKLTTGKAIGVDSWNSKQLSDNWAEATWENARLEGVDDRVEVRDGDMRELPLDNESFDIAMSCNVIYDLDTARQRRKVTDEIFRVLKPGGSVHLIEPGFSSGIMSALRLSGFEDVRRSGLSFNLFPPGRRITAVKPFSSASANGLRQNTQAVQESEITQALKAMDDPSNGSQPTDVQ